MAELFDDRGAGEAGGNGSGPDAADGSPVPPAPTPDEARALIVGEKYPLFAKSFKLFDEAGFRPVFSWPPLLFGVLWLLYRRMYLETAAVLAVSLLIPNGAATLPLAVFLALSARWLYWKAVDRRLEKALLLFPREPDKALNWLKAKDATDPYSPAAAAAFWVLYIRYNWTEIISAAAGAS